MSTQISLKMSHKKPHLLALITVEAPNRQATLQAPVEAVQVALRVQKVPVLPLQAVT